MSLRLTIGSVPVLAYKLFWYGYTGFGPRINPEEVGDYMHRIGVAALNNEPLRRMRRMLETAAGKESIMVTTRHLT